MNNTFTLNPNPQTEAFLTEKRKDPVTGETFKEGDEIVFCASCKSAFLKGSWEYMGGEHCGQKETLDTLTQTLGDELILKGKGGDTLIALSTLIKRVKIPLKKISGLRIGGIILGSFVILVPFLFGAIYFFKKNSSDFFNLYILFSVAVGLISLFLRFTKTFYTEKRALKNELRRSGVLLNNEYIPYQNIVECRVSYAQSAYISEEDIVLFPTSETTELSKEELQEVSYLFKLHFFFTEEDKQITVNICNMMSLSAREQLLSNILQISDKLRLVISPNSFTEEEDEFIRHKAEETGNIYYTESLYHGYF